MLDAVDFSGRPFHFIGIGGIGMSGLAYILAKRQLPVSGSDLRASQITQRLQELGTHVFWKQEAANLKFFCSETTNDYFPITQPIASEQAAVNSHANTADDHCLPQVICSTAIQPNNLELQAAQQLGCPIFHRADLLAALMQDYQSIAVAGTHGKTTTSSLMGHLLLQAGLDPTIVVGGEVKAWEGNARIGQGNYLVAEADESDGSLIKFFPHIGVITNIELDHPDHYKTLEEVIHTFKTFADHCDVVVGCVDCPTVRDHFFSSPAANRVSYSLNPDSKADYTVTQVTYGAEGTIAKIWERGEYLGQLHVKLLERHNLSNALAAVAVGRLLKLDFATITAAIATFEGACRRFEHRGEANGICFIDDYAHHPSEIRATLAAARLQVEPQENGIAPRKRVVAVFQPHRYSRTLAFLSEFSQGFSCADLVVVTDIYSAGEANPGHIDGQQLTAAIAEHHTQVSYQPTLPDVTQFLQTNLLPGDLVIFLSAGNLNQIIPEIVAHYHHLE